MDQDEENILFQNDKKRIGKWKGDKLNEYRCNIDTNEVDEMLFQLYMYNDNIDIVDKNDVNRIIKDITDVLTEFAKAILGKSVSNKEVYKSSITNCSK